MNERLSRMIARAYQLGWLSREGLATARELAREGTVTDAALVDRGLLDAGQLARLQAELGSPPDQRGEAEEEPGAGLEGAVTVAATAAPQVVSGFGTAELSEGDLVGPYRITGTLGAGGMGIVYTGVHRQLDRSVALKVVHPMALGDEHTTARFEREVQAAARLEHENIVRVLEVGREGDLPYFAMELLSGSPLDRVLMATGALKPDRAARLALGIARGLAHAHARGIVHRDIKPSNVLITSGADGERPVVIDFGLARHAGAATLTLTDQVIGTPVYMSPEQASGRTAAAGPLADVYSLGATLYEMLAGRPPFPGHSPIELIHRILREDPKPLGLITSGMPRDLETIVARAMEKEPPARYPSSAAMASDLEAFLAGRPIMARPVGLLGRLARRARRNRAVAVTVLVATVLVLGLAAWSVAEKIEDYGRALDAEKSERESRLIAQEERDRARQRARAQDEVLQAIRLRESGADPAVVIERFMASEREDPSYYGVFQQRGRYLLERGEIEAAQKELDRALDLKPSDALSLFYSHQAHERRGSPASHLESLLDSLAVNTGGAELAAWARARQLQASARQRREPEEMVGDLLAARTELDESIRQAPRFVRALVDRATVVSALGDYIKARGDLELALDMAPTDPGVLTSMAELQRVYENLDECLTLCNRALYQHPRHADARRVRARIELELGLVRQARDDIDSAIELDPDADSLAMAVEIEIAAGNLDRAGIRLEALLGVEGRSLRALECAARVAMLRGDREVARKHASEMTEAAPEDPRGWLALGRISLLRAEPEAARQAIHRALELAPAWRRLGGELGSWQESLCLVALGELALEEGRHDDALDLCDRAHRVGYHPSDHHFLELRIHLDRNDVEAAKSAISPLDSSQAQVVQMAMARAELLLAQDQQDDAIASLAETVLQCPGAVAPRRKLADLAPDHTALEPLPHVEALIETAQAAISDDAFAAATRAAHAALRAAPESWRPYWIMGIILDHRDDREAALSWHDRAVARDPTSPQVYYSRGRLRYRMKRNEDALADLDRAVSLAPSAENLKARSLVHKRLRQTARALADLDRALEFEPDNASCLLHRGNLFMELGRPERALVDYEEAAAAGSTSPLLQLAHGLSLRALQRSREALAELTAFRDANPDYKSMELLERDIDELEDELRAADE